MFFSQDLVQRKEGIPVSDEESFLLNFRSEVGQD